MYQNSLKGIGLQFFADPPADPTPATPPPTPPVDPPAVPPVLPVTPPASDKTYTQEQLNAMMANEKRTARQAILRELGVELKDEKDYKTMVGELKKTLDAGKTQAQLDAEAKTAAETAKLAAEARAQAAEYKITALTKRVNPEAMEDVIALAMPKVTDTKSFEMVLDELKAKYPQFFEDGETGTGSHLNPPRKSTGPNEGLGTRLAKQTKQAPIKSAYFKN